MTSIAQTVAQVRSLGMRPISWLLVVLALTACQPVHPAEESASASGPSIPHYTIDVTDKSIAIPAEIPAGLATFTIKNSTSQPPFSDLIIGRIKDGKSVDELKEALAGDDPTAFLAMADLLGSTFGDITFDLQPGQCFTFLNTDDDSGPELATFMVTGNAPAVAKPKADVQVEMVDFSFKMPDQIKAGPHTWQITNSGSQWHNMWIWKLNDGVSKEQFLDWFMGEDHNNPLGTSVFDASPSTPGMTAWTTLDLSAGNYLVLCPLPDFSDNPPMPHAAKGMVQKLTVTE